MTTLYEQHKAEWDRIAKDGFPNLCTMAKHFRRASEMDDAIGYKNCVVGWLVGRNNPTPVEEKSASMWVSLNVIETEVTSIPSQKGMLLLVACPAGTEEKARKLLAFIGCDVTEV